MEPSVFLICDSTNLKIRKPRVPPKTSREPQANKLRKVNLATKIRANKLRARAIAEFLGLRHKKISWTKKIDCNF